MGKGQVTHEMFGVHGQISMIEVQQDNVHGCSMIHADWVNVFLIVLELARTMMRSVGVPSIEPSVPSMMVISKLLSNSDMCDVPFIVIEADDLAFGIWT